MSNTNILTKIRELVGVEDNDGLLEAIQALKQPQAQPVTLAVTWTPGTPELQAVVSVLSSDRVPFLVLSATLRAGLAVMDRQITQRAAQLEQMLQQERMKNKLCTPPEPEQSIEGVA